MRTKADAARIVEALKKEYPTNICSLDYDNAWQLMVSVRLSAQCTDERVNQITPLVFGRWPTLEALAAADVVELEDVVRPCGLGHSKARDISAAAKMLVTQYNGHLPGTMADLLKIPGIGRKSANLILGDIFHQPGVVIADTHCIRMANRLGFIDSKDPKKVEDTLRGVLPSEESNDYCHRCVLHGRKVCTARIAHCDLCVLKALCPTAKHKE